MKLLNKLLWKSKNKVQMLLAAIGALLGLFLLLSAIQFYADLQGLMGKGSQNDDQFVLINKKVNLFNTLGAKSSFTPEEVEKIKDQTFVNDLASFTPNLYKVSASSSMLGFYTELFFEALPDQFLDVDLDDWGWEAGQKTLPIILSRDYLALYNFGFAPSQGLPQFTQSTIKKVSLDINIGRGYEKQVFQGHIVGFSDRINSILVPLEFMEWANGKFGKGKTAGSSRMVIATDNPYAKDLANFLEDNAYEVSSGRLIGGQIAIIIQVLILLLALLGLIIVVLSILILILNFQLLISRSSADIKRLLQIGYKPGNVAKTLQLYLIKIFVVVVLFSLLAVFFLKKSIYSWILSQGLTIDKGLHFSVYVAAFMTGLALIFLSYRTINKNISQLR